MFKNKWRCEVYRCTLQGTNISHLGTKENHLQKCRLGWDMLVPRKVFLSYLSKKQPLHTSNQPSPPKTPLEHSLFGHPLLSLRYAKGSCVPRSMVLELVSVDTETSGSFLHNSGGATSQLKTLEIFTNSLWFLYEWMGRTIMVEKI